MLCLEAVEREVGEVAHSAELKARGFEDLQIPDFDPLKPWNDVAVPEIVTAAHTLEEIVNGIEGGATASARQNEQTATVFRQTADAVIVGSVADAEVCDLARDHTVGQRVVDRIRADDDGILRAEKADFSYNYMENRQVIVVRGDSGIKAAADLSGKQGAAESGSAGETYGNSFEGAVIKGFNYQTDCLFEVNAGTVDFAVLDAQLARSYCGKGDYANLTIVDALSSDVEFYAIGFKKGSDLTAKVNEQLEKLGADGTITKLAEKYEVANTAITDFADQK
jgi:hypothetical protein